MNKTLVFDMDGTFVNLYGVDGWLNDLRNYNTRPYDVAEPLYDMDALNAVLDVFRLQGWRISVTTWLSKESTTEYDEAVAISKINWNVRHSFRYDEIHIVKYGTPKADCTRDLGGIQVLIDDDERVRKSWDLGPTIDANKNIIDELVKLLEKTV